MREKVLMRLIFAGLVGTLTVATIAKFGLTLAHVLYRIALQLTP